MASDDFITIFGVDYVKKDMVCSSWLPNAFKKGKSEGRQETIEETINILKGLDRYTADMYENIVKNAEHYNGGRV